MAEEQVQSQDVQITQSEPQQQITYEQLLPTTEHL